ncbi:MAG: cell division protein ZipA [Psychromonas sp.]|nr:cell division protein ZipA [Psychromonas sp.]
MQHFQSILIVIGLLAIAAVLIHGYLVSRKEKLSAIDHSSDSDDSSSPQKEEDIQDGIIGDVRITRAYEDVKGEQENCDFAVSPQTDDDIEELNFAENVFADDTDGENVTEAVVFEDEVPVLNEVENLADDKQIEQKQSHLENEHAVAEKKEYFIFNVAAKEGKQVRGHELLQFFLTAGFRFGEMSIFHRHLHSDGTGPVLFSIANMMLPGVFDLENIEQFHSEGVSFFLTAPNDQIDIKKAFDMMLVAVEQMAEEFDCVVLNEARELFTEEQFREYHERLLRYI